MNLTPRYPCILCRTVPVILPGGAIFRGQVDDSFIRAIYAGWHGVGQRFVVGMRTPPDRLIAIMVDGVAERGPQWHASSVVKLRH